MLKGNVVENFPCCMKILYDFFTQDPCTFCFTKNIHACINATRTTILQVQLEVIITLIVIMIIFKNNITINNINFNKECKNNNINKNDFNSINL